MFPYLIFSPAPFFAYSLFVLTHFSFSPFVLDLFVFMLLHPFFFISVSFFLLQKKINIFLWSISPDEIVLFLSPFLSFSISFCFTSYSFSFQLLLSRFLISITFSLSSSPSSRSPFFFTSSFLNSFWDVLEISLRILICHFFLYLSFGKKKHLTSKLSQWEYFFCTSLPLYCPFFFIMFRMCHLLFFFLLFFCQRFLVFF